MMSRRRILTLPGGTEVYCESHEFPGGHGIHYEGAEYTVIPPGSLPDAWYHTTDRRDAIDTAEAMDAKPAAMARYFERADDDTLDLY